MLRFHATTFLSHTLKSLCNIIAVLFFTQAFLCQELNVQYRPEFERLFDLTHFFFFFWQNVDLVTSIRWGVWCEASALRNQWFAGGNMSDAGVKRVVYFVREYLKYL